MKKVALLLLLAVAMLFVAQPAQAAPTMDPSAPTCTGSMIVGVNCHQFTVNVTPNPSSGVAEHWISVNGVIKSSNWQYTEDWGSRTSVQVKAYIRWTSGATWNQTQTITRPACPLLKAFIDKYNDLDGDGNRDTNEPGLQGFTFHWEASTAQSGYVTTDSNGHAYISAFPENTWVDITEQPKNNWVATTPNPVRLMLVSADQTAVFGNHYSPPQPPVCRIDTVPTEGIAPLQVAFFGQNSSDPDGQIVSYAWNFAGFGTSNEPATFFTFTQPGTHTVNLTVTDNDGLSSSCSKPITVSEPPNQPPTCSIAATPDQGQAPLNVAFDASDSNDPDGTIASYAWDFAGFGSSTAATDQFVFEQVGSHDVTLTVTDDDGATVSCQKTIVVVEKPNDPPVCAFDAHPQRGYTPLNVEFDAAGSHDPDGTIASYVWDFAGLADGSGVTTSYTFVEPTSHVVRLTVFDDDGMSASCEKTIVVLEKPNEPPVCAIGANPLTGPAPLNVMYMGGDSSDPDGIVTQWIWDFAGQADGSGPIVSHIWDTPGTYTTTLTVFDNDGASASCSIPVLVTPRSYALYLPGIFWNTNDYVPCKSRWVDASVTEMGLTGKLDYGLWPGPVYTVGTIGYGHHLTAITNDGANVNWELWWYHVWSWWPNLRYHYLPSGPGWWLSGILPAYGGAYDWNHPQAGEPYSLLSNYTDVDPATGKQYRCGFQLNVTWDPDETSLKSTLSAPADKYPGFILVKPK